MNTVLKLLCLHTFLYPLEWCFKKQGILRYPGDFTNKIISIFCVYKMVYTALTEDDSKNIIPFLMDYSVYDILWICSDKKTFLHNYIFIIHHLLTVLLCLIEQTENFGNGIFVILEITSPLLNITKITQAICPIFYPKIQSFTKNSYYFFRILIPPYWIIYKLLTHYTWSFNHNFIISGVFALWQASIIWYRKML
jgi:hypothetical protein